jgi:hypothetical protein
MVELRACTHASYPLRPAPGSASVVRRHGMTRFGAATAHLFALRYWRATPLTMQATDLPHRKPGENQCVSQRLE